MDTAGIEPAFLHTVFTRAQDACQLHHVSKLLLTRRKHRHASAQSHFNLLQRCQGLNESLARALTPPGAIFAKQSNAKNLPQERLSHAQTQSHHLQLRHGESHTMQTSHQKKPNNNPMLHYNKLSYHQKNYMDNYAQHCYYPA